MTKNLRFFLMPYVIPRYYIWKSVSSFVAKHKFTGTLLDIGCGQKPYAYLFKDVSQYTGIDFESYSSNKNFTGSKPDVFFDTKYKKTLVLPFSDCAFDNCVAFQVLEHHPNPELFIREIIRVTKPGGLILITVPLLGGVHEAPHDYQRYTEFGLKELFLNQPVKLKELVGYGSISSVMASLFNEYVNGIAIRNKSWYFFAIILYLPAMLFQYSSILVDKVLLADWLVLNYTVLVKKNK